MSSLAWLTAKPIAHRGLHGEGRPENSLAAIKAAAQAGYPAEIDIRLSSDGRAVVFHDDDLFRMTGTTGTVESQTADSLTRLSLLQSLEKISLLEDVLAVLKGRTGLLIEIKHSGPLGQLETEALRCLSGYEGDFALQSFNPRSLAWLRRHAPQILRGQLSSGWDPAKPSTFWEGNYVMNLLSRPHFIGHNCERLPAAAVAFLRKRGLPVLTWTVKSAVCRERVLPYCDNIIFEQFSPEI